MILSRNIHTIINISNKFSYLLTVYWRNNLSISKSETFQFHIGLTQRIRTFQALDMKGKYSFSTHNRYQKVEIQRKNSQRQLLEDEKLKNTNGYGYYDWNDDLSYQKAIEDQYFLDDLIVGLRTLAKKQIVYNEDHLTFMVYTYLLFQSKIEKEFAELFIPNFLRLQSEQNSEYIKRKYIPLVKLLCFCSNSKIDEIKKQSRPLLSKQIEPILRKRLRTLTKKLNLEQFHDIITENCYQQMGNLQKQLETFQEIVNELFQKKKYKIDWNEVRLIISIYQKMILFDNELKNHQFFSRFPGIFESDEESFVNLLNVLPDILTYNFVNFTSDIDILKLHKRISQCTNFKQKKTKIQIRRYSEHLVLIGKAELINFQKILDFI